MSQSPDTKYVVYPLIDNCPQARATSENVKFKYPCPKKWTSLQETEDVNIRFCNVCENSVYYCETLGEVNYHKTQEHCIAVARVNKNPDYREDLMSEMGIVG